MTLTGDHWICADCVEEPYLSDEIARLGTPARCDLCGETGPAIMVEDLADRIEVAFETHYLRTSDQPSDWEHHLLGDKESGYDWWRHGEPVVHALAGAAQIPDEAAEAVQAILEKRHGDRHKAEVGEETEFSSDSHYEEAEVDSWEWKFSWDHFERDLKTKARFFSHAAAATLKGLFEDLDGLAAGNVQPFIVAAGPGTDLERLHRARVFQSEADLKAALGRPDEQLGPPPSRLATAGRMNAQGIAVFYGATSPDVALSEVRPPVGSWVAIAPFAIRRRLRLLDLGALSELRTSGSIFDPGFAARLERIGFLRSLSARMARPILPRDEALDYLPTQAVAEFLAARMEPRLDGIVYPSPQTATEGWNVVLFHHAARVEPLDLPEGTIVDVRTSSMTEDGREPDYFVWVTTPPAGPNEEPDPDPKTRWPASLTAMPDSDWDGFSDDRDPALKVDVEAIAVHHVGAVRYTTDEFPVRWRVHEAREPEF